MVKKTESANKKNGASTKVPKKTKKKTPETDEKAKEKKMYQKYLRSKQFEEVKEIVHKRDGERCCFCGRDAEECAEANTQLQVHHCTYKALGKGGEEEAETCHLFCGICHRASHYAPSNRTRYQDKSPVMKNWKEINGDKC